MFFVGSSKIFNKALTAFLFKNSILSTKINLGLLLIEDLFKEEINSLIWSISMFFFSCFISILIKFGLDPFKTVLNE